MMLLKEEQLSLLQSDRKSGAKEYKVGAGMKKKGVNINLLSIGIFTLVAVILLFFGMKVREASLGVREQTAIEENRRLCELESRVLADGSDYLTSEVWHFVATRDETYLKNYWNEVNVSRSREKALEHLKELSLTDGELRLVERAKEASDGLIEGEAWAMRLVADSIGLSPEQMPAEVAAVRYSQGEEALSPEEKVNLASKYIFGPEYTAVKEEIKSSLDSFRRLLLQRKTDELDTAARKARSALRAAGHLMTALIVVILLNVVLFCIFVLRPFSHYTRSLQRMGADFTTLTPIGSRETIALAGAFNQICMEWREQKRVLEQERYRFRVALENTSMVVFEYDVNTDNYTAYGTLASYDGQTNAQGQEWSIPHFAEGYAREVMGPEGISLFRKILNGEEHGPLELQVCPYNNHSRKIWVRCTSTAIYDDNHRVIKVIGKISNIQSEKEKEFALEDMRSRDGLTGLFKREVGIRKIREYMARKPANEICGLMLLDMDDFGRLNESEGKTFADAVLQDAADILRAETRPEDILIRLGGDEFMLFVKDCPKSRAKDLGSLIASRIRAISGHQNQELKVSASIGMCETSVVENYTGLYRCAESTLKYLKEHDKGQAACYMDVCNELGMLLTQMYPESHFINEIDRQEGAVEDLPAFALDLLGKARNLDDAIFLLLSRVGKNLDLDRVMIVEMDAEYLSCRVAYQWSKNPMDRKKKELIYMTQQKLEEVAEAYDEEGLCDRRIITGPCPFESILHAAIWNYGQCAGAVSFERRQPHRWTPEERLLLSELTKIISSFTLKARADAVSRAKTDFLSRMSHEIRTPMNAITGMTMIAKTALNDPAKLLDCLNKIESSNRYLISLINDVLDVSRIESGKLELHTAPMDIGRLVENLEILLRPQAEAKELRLVIENGAACGCLVEADELRLNQVLVNLLGNAVKFTGEGGTITLEIEPTRRTAEETELSFSVTDTGIGISREAQLRIFNAFEQAGSDTVSKYGGTGLGLTISSRLVQMMGGSLKVESEPGKGSRFSFRVTLKNASARAEETESGGNEEMPLFDPNGKRLLLVEDNAMNREIAQEILGMQGFKVETAENGLEAVEQFERNIPGYYHAILMDIRMPVMGGMEAARRIRTMQKPDSRTVPIIAMTANAFDEDMKKSLENGMNAHLSKPFDVEKLMETLRRMIKEGG